MREKVAVIVRGCPKNEVDAQILAGELINRDFSLTSNLNKANIVIIFTCAFIKDAVEESLETIFETSLICNRILVTGCLPNRYSLNELSELIPEVEKFFGTYNYMDIIDYIEKRKDFNETIGKFIYSSKNHRISEYCFSYVKIAEGCSNSCTFCTIPKIKGRYFSRKSDDIVDEIKFLTEEKGIGEIILVSQNNGFYGRDIGESLENLIKKLLKINSLQWLRLLYIYPDDISERLLELTLHEKFCNYLDIPIQHIDNDILKAMGRKSGEKEIKEKLSKIKEFYPDIFVRTSLIVGFPGETEEKFEKLLKFVNEYEFYNIGCFKYSPEEGTRAAHFKSQVKESVKNRRYRRIMKEQKKIANKLNKALIGNHYQILVEGYSDETELLLTARTQFQSPDIDGVTLINKGFAEKGLFYNVKLTGYKDYDLIGEIV